MELRKMNLPYELNKFTLFINFTVRPFYLMLLHLLCTTIDNFTILQMSNTPFIGDDKFNDWLLTTTPETHMSRPQQNHTAQTAHM